MIKFRCKQCGRKIGMADHYAGKRAKCPACGAATVVPSLEMPVSSAIDLSCELSDRSQTPNALAMFLCTLRRRLMAKPAKTIGWAIFAIVSLSIAILIARYVHQQHQEKLFRAYAKDLTDALLGLDLSIENHDFGTGTEEVSKILVQVDNSALNDLRRQSIHDMAKPAMDRWHAARRKDDELKRQGVIFFEGKMMAIAVRDTILKERAKQQQEDLVRRETGRQIAQLLEEQKSQAVKLAKEAALGVESFWQRGEDCSVEIAAITERGDQLIAEGKISYSYMGTASEAEKLPEAAHLARGGGYRIQAGEAVQTLRRTGYRSFVCRLRRSPTMLVEGIEYADAKVVTAEQKAKMVALVNYFMARLKAGDANWILRTPCTPSLHRMPKDLDPTGHSVLNVGSNSQSEFCAFVLVNRTNGESPVVLACTASESAVSGAMELSGGWWCSSREVTIENVNLIKLRELENANRRLAAGQRHEASFEASVSAINQIDKAARQGVSYDEFSRLFAQLVAAERAIYVEVGDRTMQDNLSIVRAIREQFAAALQEWSDANKRRGRLKVASNGNYQPFERLAMRGIEMGNEFVESYEAAFPNRHKEEEVPVPPGDRNIDKAARDWCGLEIAAINQWINDAIAKESEWSSQLPNPDPVKNQDLQLKIKSSQEERQTLGARLTELRQMAGTALADEYRKTSESDARLKKAQQLFKSFGKFELCAMCVGSKAPHDADGAMSKGVERFIAKFVQPDPECLSCKGTGFVPAR